MTKYELNTMKNNPLKLLRCLKAEKVIYIMTNIDNWNDKSRSYRSRIFWMEGAIRAYRELKVLEHKYMIILKISAKYRKYSRSNQSQQIKLGDNCDKMRSV